MLNRSKELRTLAERLISLVLDEDNGSVRDEGAVDQHGEADPVDEVRLGRIALNIYQSRRLRAKLLPPDLLGEPVWDMLLDLVIQRMFGRRVSVTSLTIASGVPSTTTLRWIKVLIDHGLISREESAEDRRKVYIELTDKGYQVMHRLLANLPTRRDDGVPSFKRVPWTGR